MCFFKLFFLKYKKSEKKYKKKLSKIIKKLIIKLTGKKQQTINIQKLLQQGLDPDQVEDAVSRKLHELEDSIVSVEFVLNVQSIAETVQPETDRLLGKL